MKAISPVHKFKPAHHTPAQTKKWMRETFAKAKERFSHFYEVLDARKPIPDRYLSSKSSDGQGCNRTLRFYRLESLIDIIAAIRNLIEKGKPGIKELAKLIKEVLIPFDEGWLSLFNKLDNYYSHQDSTALLRAKYENLRFASKVFQGGAETLMERAKHENGNRNLDIYEEIFNKALNEFENEFERLPHHTPKATATHPKFLSEIPFDPSCDKYYSDQLAGIWTGTSRHEGRKDIFIRPVDKDGHVGPPLYQLLISGTIYTATNHKATVKFNIPSIEARAFVDLLIDSLDNKFEKKGGILKPTVTKKTGVMKGAGTTLDFHLSQFKSKPTEIMGQKILGSDDFWKRLVVAQNPGKLDRRVTLGLRKVQSKTAKTISKT